MDYAAYSQFVLALLFVLALIGVLGAIARRLGFGGIRAVGGASARRITIAEVRPLDAKRKLVLVRRDQVEHLIIIGPTGETVIERGIIGSSHGDFAGALCQAAGDSGPATGSRR